MRASPPARADGRSDCLTQIGARLRPGELRRRDQRVEERRDPGAPLGASPVVCQKSDDPKRQQFPNTGGWQDRRSRPCVRRPGGNPCSLAEISLFPNVGNSPARTSSGAGSETLASPEAGIWTTSLHFPCRSGIRSRDEFAIDCAHRQPVCCCRDFPLELEVPIDRARGPIVYIQPNDCRFSESGSLRWRSTRSRSWKVSSNAPDDACRAKTPSTQASSPGHG